jgi:hypothetical protein
MIQVYPLHNAKELGHVHTIQCLILFLINISLHHIVPLYPNCLLCLFLEIYMRHLMIQNGGQRCMKRWKLFTRTRPGIWSNYLMERRLLAASGCSLSSIRPMVLWNDTKPDLLQKALPRPMGLIMRKHLHL